MTPWTTATEYWSVNKIIGEASIRTATADSVSDLLSPAVAPVVSAVEVCDECEVEEE